MEVKKAIKKVLALVTGVSMVGTTLLGAMAADLSTYPEPFVSGGAFDALIVVGEKAAAEDIVGSIDISTSLQYAIAVPISGDSTTTTVSTVSEGRKIEKSGAELNIDARNGTTLSSIWDSQITDTYMPSIMADGEYVTDSGRTTKFEQYISLGLESPVVIFEDEDLTEDKIVDNYLRFTKGKDVYTYTLEFSGNGINLKNTSTDQVDACQSEIKSTKIQIQGRQYTISDVICETSEQGSTVGIESLTLMAGDTVMWIQQDQVITKVIDGVEHEIMVVDVSRDSDSCGISVDGVVKWIDQDKTEEINGLEIGISDVKAVYSQLQDTDICEVNIGADEILLEEGNNVEKSNVEIKDSTISFADNGYLTNMKITYTPKDTDYKKVGEEWVDPVFGNFKFVFSSLEKNTEVMSFDVSSDEGVFTFKNYDKDAVEIPIYIDGSTPAIVKFGESAEKPMIVDAATETVCPTLGYDGCEDVMLWFSDSGNVPHILQISSISNNSVGDADEIEIDDLTTGSSYEITRLVNETSFNIESPDAQIISLGALGSLSIKYGINATATIITVDVLAAGAGARYETSLGAGILLDSSGNATISINESVVIDVPADGSPSDITIETAYDSDASDIEIKEPKSLPDNAGYNLLGFRKPTDSDDTYEVGQTGDWGTYLKYNSDDKDSLKIWYPEEAVIANVYVAPTTATVSTTLASGTPVTLTKINVGSAKLDSEVSAKAQNVIIVGGPCANSAAAAWAGVTYQGADCATGFEAGKGMLKIYEEGGKVALLVAGYSAADTRAAARVLSKYNDYALSGKEMVVTYTDLSQISVSSPQ